MEKLLLNIAWVLRFLPTIRGKYRFGLFLEEILLKKGVWGTRELKIKLKNGLDMLIDPRSLSHKGPLYCGEYDDDEIKQFCKIFKSGWVVFDIGASIGYWTLPFVREIKMLGNGQVVSFEPLPANYNKLKENLKINKLLEDVITKDYALGNFDGKIKIHATEAGNTGNAYIGNKTLANILHNYDVEIEIKRLDGMLADFVRCDFIKMDIEGAEILVLQGGVKFIERFRPIIFGEFNSLFLSNLGYSILDISEILKRLDYIPFQKSKGVFKEVRLREGMEDILFVPHSRLLEVQSIIF